jgi:cytochrome oxidase Cu insertion factor (SCO1/SenC/PrrC family)/thiol-disulfide isomerase/thioredoxin
MLRQTRLALTLAAGVVAAIVIVLSVVQLRHYDNRRSSAAQVPAPLAVGTALQRPRPVPAMRLTDSSGKPFSTTQWRGKWVVLAPSLTLCHEVCPMTTAALNQIRQQVDRQGLGKQVTVAEVTVDPWRDTPGRLRAYRRLSSASFQLATGTPAQIEQVWRFFGVYYTRVPQGKPPDVDWMTGKPETFDVDHTNAVFIIDPAGQERIVDEGMPDVSGTLPAGLHKLLNEEGVHNLAHPQFGWTPKEVIQDLYHLMNRNLPASAVAPVKPPSPAAAARALSNSPHPLATLHQQAGALLPADQSLPAAVRALRGYPVVINAWASWCGPCRAEFSLFALASAKYGRRVAFLGNDTNDSATDAKKFLSQHPVSYPSYQGSQSGLGSLAQIAGLPTTIFVGRSGRVVYVHTGSYDAPTTLQQDIERYALGA